MKRPAQMLLTLAGLALLWMLLTGGEASAWVVGVPTLAAATWTVWRLRAGPGERLSVPGALRFLPVFIWESVRGGVDVAARTLGPRLRVRPGFTSYRTGLVRSDARVFFANCVCLLPGTLAAELDGDRIDLHLLDAGMDTDAELRRLEAAVARIYP